MKSTSHQRTIIIGTYSFNCEVIFQGVFQFVPGSWIMIAIDSLITGLYILVLMVSFAQFTFLKLIQSRLEVFFLPATNLWPLSVLLIQSSLTLLYDMTSALLQWKARWYLSWSFLTLIEFTRNSTLLNGKVFILMKWMLRWLRLKCIKSSEVEVPSKNKW
jgi:hypothetical protein